MARASAGKSNTASRIRFIMLEAESDGDLSQITQAIQNALRPPSAATSPQRLAAPARAVVHDGNGADVSAGEDEAELEETIEQDDAAPATSRARSQRRPPKAPPVLPIDMHSPVSFADFASGKDAKSQHKKYLIAAAWLKEHRQTPAVSEGHIYTCFRSIEWPTNIPDFGQPLRDLKKKQYFDKTEAGYEINHLGLDYVRKLGGD
jgi:hypothetical protein